MNFSRQRRSEPHLPFLVGLLVGGAAVALIAPLTGRDLRRRIGERGGDALNNGWRKTKESAGAMAEEAANMMERGKETIRGEGARLQSALDAAKTAYREEHPS